MFRAIIAIILSLISPQIFGTILGAVAGPIAGQVLGSDTTASSQNGYSAAPAYQPTWQGGADQSWQQNYNNANNLTGSVANTTTPMYNQTLQQQQAINYNPYQQAANQAGQAYQNQANNAGQQANMYGQAAQQAQGQQQSLYGAGQQIYNTAFDPNQAQFKQSQQQLSDQVNAGQAQRGLGNSAVGASEYNNAMQNFDTAWHTNQLANQATGIQGMSQASNAGGAQGQLYGVNLQGQQTAYGQQATGQLAAGQTPLTAQQYVAGQPAANANSYGQNFNNLQSMYGNNMNNAQAYMGMGQTANTNAYNQYQQQQGINIGNNAGISNIGTQVGSAIGSNPNVQSWLGTNIFGNNSLTSSTDMTYNPNGG
jgi:hypothetical protein